MKARYRLIRRGIRGGAFYSVDTKTGRRTSLGTPTRTRPRKSSRPRTSPSASRCSISKLPKPIWPGQTAASPPALAAGNGDAHGRQAGSQPRTLVACATDRALAPLLPRTIVDTPGELMLKVLQSGTVSTNVFLRRLHNFCLDMNWLAWPLVPKRQWPAVRYKDKRAITWRNTARSLSARRTRNAKPSISWPGMSGRRNRTWRTASRGRGLAGTNYLFLSDENALAWVAAAADSIRQGSGGHSCNAAQNRPPLSLSHHCQRKIPRHGIQATLHGTRHRRRDAHSYRYAWAERAKTAGYPERFAQLALGHNSKAVHRAYARKAQVTLPPLEEYEAKIVQFSAAQAAAQDESTESADVVSA